MGNHRRACLGLSALCFLAAGAAPVPSAYPRDAAERGRTLRRHAVAWVLEQPGVTAAIVGARNAREGAELPSLAAD